MVPVKELAGRRRRSFRATAAYRRSWRRTGNGGLHVSGAGARPARSTRAPIFFLSASRFTRCAPAARPSPGDTTGELLIAIVQQVQITPARLESRCSAGVSAHHRSVPAERSGISDTITRARSARTSKEVQRNPAGRDSHYLPCTWNSFIGPRIFRVPAFRRHCPGAASVPHPQLRRPNLFWTLHTPAMAADLFRAADSLPRCSWPFS